MSKFDAVTSCLVRKVEIRSERYKIISLHLKILIFHKLIKLMYTKKHTSWPGSLVENYAGNCGFVKVNSYSPSIILGSWWLESVG